jgi:hypothetical protein
MRYLRKFNESLIGDKANDKIRIAGNIKDIFVGYQDSHDLDVDIETFAPGLGLPSTLMHLDDNVLMVKLFAQRGIRFGEISGEIGMLIEYMKSLTDKEVKIYYELDRGGLRNWRPLAGSDNEFDYYLQGKEMSFNTIRMYFVECIGKTNESFITDTHYKDKIVDDITDMFIELKDAGLNYLVSMQDNSTVDIAIYKKKKDVNFDLDLVRDCAEMTKDYLSDLGDVKEFYRFGYVSERVTGKMTNDVPVYTKKTGRDNIEYSSFPDNWSEDVENKHALEHRFDYELEGIKIVFKQK